MRHSLFMKKFLALFLALTFVLPQSACSTPISASATEDESAEIETMDTEVDATMEDMGYVYDEEKGAYVYEGEEDEFETTFKPEDDRTEEEITADEWGFELEEDETLELPEDPLERLQFNIDRLPDPEFWETVEDPLDMSMLQSKYGGFADELMEEVYELSDEDLETLDISRLEAYFTYDNSDVSTMAGDTDRLNTHLQVLPESFYDPNTFPDEYSRLVFYTRFIKRADEIGASCSVQMRSHQIIKAPAGTMGKRNDVWFRLNRVARLDDQDYDLKVYMWSTRPGHRATVSLPGFISIRGEAGGLNWSDEQPIIYTEYHFINSDTGAEDLVKGALTIKDIDWHWGADLGTGPSDPDNTSKRESVGLMQGGVRAYLDPNTKVCRKSSTFGAWNNFTNWPYARNPIGGMPPAGWYWGTDDVNAANPNSHVTFTFESSQAKPLTLAYYGSWHYATAIDSTISEVHYNIAPKSEWFPDASDLSGCTNAEKDHCIKVDTSIAYRTYSVSQYQNNLTVKPDPNDYVWHGWYMDKSCTKKAPASWTTVDSSVTMLYGWYERINKPEEGGTDLQLTKTLEQTSNGPEDRINNQDTWNIILTQEYTDDRPMSKARLRYAPLGGYLNLLVDITSSMKGMPLENVNKSIENLVDQVLAENQLRMENARNGEYADINGALPEAQLLAAMDEHLVHIDRAAGFHSSVRTKSYKGNNGAVSPWEAAPTTEAEAAALKAALTFSDSECGNGTGMSNAMDWFDDKFSRVEHVGTVHVSATETIEQRLDYLIFVTDGMPDVKGERYSSLTTSAKASDVNSSIGTAAGIKEQGVKIYGIWDRGVPYSKIRNAVEAKNGKGDINELPLPCSDILPELYMGLMTSDSPKGGNIAYYWKRPVNGLHIFWLDIPAQTYDRNKCYSVNESSENGFGKYTHFGNKSSDVVNIMESITSEIMADGWASTITTYMGAGSYAYDVVSDPFEITNIEAIQVYAVPRIPAELDADGKPLGVVTDKADENYGIVTDFRYGEELIADAVEGEPASEWIDVTDQVIVSAKGGVVKVSGWDYESNALTPFDKDLLKATNKVDPFIYEPGDYGYKIVVKIPINAKKTFGGNNIETNNRDTSAFFPSIPGGPTSPNDPDYIPRWPENTEENPDGHEYIKKYDNPKVDLYMDYKIVSDVINIYAPQTGELLNLVSDINGSIWNEDPAYASTKQNTETLQKLYEDALDRAKSASQELTEDSTDADRANVEKLFSAAEKAKDDWLSMKDTLDNLESYRPDGINNAFVDIDYTFTDPDGEVMGRMHIPHGRAYAYDENGVPNIQWEITGGNDRIITKSGAYGISCTVTPADTERAPGGHVYTSADIVYRDEYDEAGNKTGNIIATHDGNYFSEDYSPTGSTAAGREKPMTITAEGAAHLFYMEILARDSRLMPRQTFDFFEGNEYMYASKNPHIGDYRWVCTDGVTESEPENEPGAGLIYADDPNIIPALTMGLGEPNITVSGVPEEAFNDGLAMDIMGTRCTGETDGSYVPVGVNVARDCGIINKSASIADRVRLRTVAMTDEDNIWNNGSNSVNWDHECDDLENCELTAFQEAQAGYSTAEHGKIRYLIHVANNPKPEIHKTTSTPTISKGDDIKWEVKLTNGNETENPKHYASDFHLVDVLPFVGDTDRIDPLTNHEGSKFSGDLKYTAIAFDLSNTPTLFERLKDGKAAVYLTTSLDARTADEETMTDVSEDGALKWKKVNVVLDEEKMTASVPDISEDVVAFNLAGRLGYGEEVRASLVANMKVFNDQQVGDYYHNRAVVYNGNGGRYSETVATKVGWLFIRGTIWEDYDANGLMAGSEKRIDRIPVTLYREFNPNNGGTPDRVIGNLKLTQAFAADQNKIPVVLTGEDGLFEFDNVQKGTFYIVADNIPDKYAVTVQRAGTDEGSEKLDSEADEGFVPNDDEEKDNSAIIRKIVVDDKSVDYQNIGLKLVLGNVKVWKTLDEIYYPTTMTEEEMEDYQLVFLFQLKNVDTGRIYKETVRMDHETYHPDENGKAQVYAEFDSLPLGTYELTESSTAQYQLEEIERYDHKIEDGVVRWDGETKTMTIEITADNHDFEVHARNKLVKDPPGGDLNGLKNWVNVRIPVKLEIKYVGPDPISDHEVSTRPFTVEDFDPAKGGDMIVTYDDGTTISLSEGTLKFEEVTLIPDAVTNDMNSGLNKVGISGYYSEKGRTVSDSFKVGVDLKPVHKFQLNFNANGSSFDDGAALNIVHFAYDDNTGHNYVTMGDYKDGLNGQLNTLPGFRFTGWNTKKDGTGVNYDGLMALDAIGMNATIDTLTLYARWTCDITFNAMGGVLQAPSTATAAEKAANGKEVAAIPIHLHQNMATQLKGSKSQFNYVLWNTKVDSTGIGRGIDLVNYGECTGPETFYAVYYQSDYTYKGRVQTFTAPVDGWYRFTLYGADGGYGNNTYAHAGIGGKVGGTIWLKQGQGFYVYVGQTAPNTISHIWTWNGGAPSPRGSSPAHWGGAGGGATDIRLLKGSSDTDWSNMASLKSRIAVAGGGGGAGSTCSGGIYPNGTRFLAPDGGNAGGLIAETIYAYHTGTGNVNGITTGANQTSGGKGRGGLDVGDTSNVSDCQGSFGKGATGPTCCSGGGGGWYGGATCYTTGGSGGSSYLIGWTGCDTTYQAYQNNLASFELKFKDAIFEAGGTWNHAEKTWGDEGGAAFLELIERTYTNGVRPN